MTATTNHRRNYSVHGLTLWLTAQLCMMMMITQPAV